MNGEKETVLIAVRLWPSQYDAWATLADSFGYVSDNRYVPGSDADKRMRLQFAVQNLLDDAYHGEPVGNDNEG
jgi:hypothetical protein